MSQGDAVGVEIDGRLAPHITATQEHDVRTSLRDRLAALPNERWLNLELTPADPTDAAMAPTTANLNPENQR